MFTKLKKKWNVSGFQFFLIFLTFGITGTFTAWVSKAITSWIEAEKYSWEWWGLKILVLLVGYQVFLLFFGFCMGQFTFFWNLEKKIFRRLGLLSPKKIKLAIFASGTGSNAKRIIEHFSRNPEVSVELVVSNKEKAGVLEMSKEKRIDTLIINRERFYQGDSYLPDFKEIDYIILAGFLWKVPEALIQKFDRRIINIHPALLPKYGGKGMYGQNVHLKVLENDEKETGITIHYVDGHYDNGDIIFQAVCNIESSDTPESIAIKVQKLEHEYFPRIIENIIKAKSSLKEKHS